MVPARAIADAVRDAIGVAASTLRPDMRAALRSALAREESPRGRAVLEQLLENARIAERDHVPLCQDTGTVWVLLELGEGSCVEGDLPAAVDEAVRGAYRANALRMSVVRDALLDRTNTGDNTPAFLDIALRPGTGVTVHVMLKGGGSDNASAVAMLDPAEGAEGVRDFVVRTVETKASGACPPLALGIGVGGTFDSVGKLAKRALLLPVGERSDGALGTFEADVLAAANALGIGPGGLGGRMTALSARVLTAPCHIAALPVAVNLGCCAMRSVTVEVG